ncbi:MAG: tRNA preQ1(34) S-adenosylmethionine ribosyltransferase-isomerase QueA [Desulfovibrio sp.]
MNRSLDVTEKDYSLAAYNFELPEENIAQSPADKRDHSKVMIINREAGTEEETTFNHIIDHLPEGALLVVNNSKVLPARIYGQKPTGGKVEFLMLTPLPLITPADAGDGWQEAEVQGLLRSSKSPKPGAEVLFGDDLVLRVIAKGDFGKSRVVLKWRGDLAAILTQLGHMPLPPYIKRPDTQEDQARYQTIYARDDKQGSVAAPTAGLHFTPELREELTKRGFKWAEVTLYVGYGTFSPVRSEDIRDHEMHEEYIEVPEETAEAIRQAKADGRPVLAVGTTSARSLEGMYAACGEICSYSGGTSIFIYPGKTFNVVDCMLTNFHLPESSLIMMIGALVGRERILSVYQKAIEKGFRFFSYGDAMLIK